MKLGSVLVAMCLLASPCLAQTPQQAQSLPLPQLARLVLGEVGSTIIDVDRPTWINHCGGPLCPPLSLEEERRRGPAPLTEQGLIFYQRAVPTPGGLPWTGLCSSTAIHVFYQESGRPGRVEMSKRFGLSAAAKRVGPFGGPEQRPNFELEQQACGTINSVQGFFYAEDETAAYRAALVSRLFARALQSGKPLPFSVTCHPSVKPCIGAAEIAKHFRVEDIRSVRETACTSRPVPGKPKPSCYEISLPELGEQVDVQLVEQHDAVRLLSIQYRIGGVEI